MHAETHLLVRTGLKQTCKTLWPTLTKVEWMEFHPEPVAILSLAYRSRKVRVPRASANEGMG